MNKKLEDLVNIIQTLRAPNGCDWDREQTSKSLIPYLLEETYEVIEAIQDENTNMLQEELGDLLLHVVFQAELASENGTFNINDVIKSINTKLIKRHPHIFNPQEKSKSLGKGNWELEKQKEKKRNSILDGIPKILPSLIKASRIQEKASSIGFDWDNIKDVKEKVYEEIQELEEAIKDNNQNDIENELGDLLFVLVNLGRHLGVDADNSLNKAVQKFYHRFNKMERLIKTEKLDLKKLSLQELDRFWDKVKSQE